MFFSVLDFWFSTLMNNSGPMNVSRRRPFHSNCRELLLKFVQRGETLISPTPCVNTRICS